MGDGLSDGLNVEGKFRQQNTFSLEFKEFQLYSKTTL